MISANTTAISAAVLLACAALGFPTGSAEGQRGGSESCPGGTLSQVQDGSDLVVKVDCTVGAGTYKFGNVNILAGGTLRFTDATIHFWAANILVENGGVLSAGSESDPIGNNGVVTIHLYGPDQTGTDPNKRGTGIKCLSDAARCGVPADIWDSNVDSGHRPVPPADARKISQMPSADQYVGVKDDYFYPYHPLPRDDADAQGYFGYKVLAVAYGGTLQLFGKKGATGECGMAPSTSGTSWARLNATAPARTQKLTLDRSVSLRDGDQIVVTTTDYLPGHSEQLTVSGDHACQSDITVKESLAYDHNGTRYPLDEGTHPGIGRVGLSRDLMSNGAETRAAVGLLTRSIRIVSAGDTKDADFPAASTGYFFGGHLVVRQGFKTFQVQGVEFFQMGQGGRLGHYPIHFHHARKTPLGTFVRDSSIHDSMTRWIVLHGTQDVTLARNVGYKSIGHGFYLEDGTEINNTLIANLGIFARAAVANAQNPRKVPGILAAPDLHETVGENFPFRSDYDHPTVFWIMNGWNDFQDNMAAGAGTCGVCYWLVPCYNSTISRDHRWESYASMQTGLARAAMTPLKSFVGNSCTSAMTSFQTVSATEACLGVATTGGFPTLPPIRNPLAGKSDPADLNYYPGVDPTGGRFATQCGGPNAEPHADCSSQPDRCTAGNPNCMVTVLDGYTTSFNWAAFNFAAIWLRPQWYLMKNSVITDSQQAGLTMVTGGGYSASDVIPGHWALVEKSVFIGHTQENNPFAFDGGPFNPRSKVQCAQDQNGNRPGNYCLSIAEGVSHQVSNFGMYQRLFSVYDGPAFQQSNAYLNIKTRTIDDCTPFVDTMNQAGRCDPKDFSRGRQSDWLAGAVSGLPKARPDEMDPKKDFCYMPNAAIGWKQPNGFYYPPAFHSANLFFHNVDIRHFVVTPLFVEGTLTTDTARVEKEYCIWNRTLFTGFAGNDRQTVLNDDDGSLTGYRTTTVINLDDFFSAPVEAIQCLSDTTSRTSPYEYVTTVVYPKCVIDGTCAKAPDPPPDNNPNTNFGDWNRACTNEQCYGVPLYRQDLMPLADKDLVKSIRMMGQQTGQRSTLTANHGTYYLDTAVGKDKQLACGATPGPCLINLFKKNEIYYLFLIFAKETTAQTYRFYVGENTNFDPASIQMVQADIGPNPVVFRNFQPLPPGRAKWLNNNKDRANGVVEVDLRVSDFPDVAQLFKDNKPKKCQPPTYCSWNVQAQACEDASGSSAACGWAVADQDCPDGGCIGIVFTLPDGFTTDPAPDPRPPAVCLKKEAPWDVTLMPAAVPDGVCPKASDTLAPDFCPPAEGRPLGR
jgi:cell migration-inducing and hyaluronan-binding protein